MSNTRARVSIGVALLFAGACRGGCGKNAAPSGPLGDELALVPGEATVIARIDAAALRAAPAWNRIADLARRDPRDEKLVAEFARRTGLDPLRQITSIVAAFPEDARRAGA